MTPDRMAMHWLLALVTLIADIRAQSNTGSNEFIIPTAPGPALQYIGNPLWHVGESQRVQWVTDVFPYTIELWQQTVDAGFGYAVSTVYDSGNDADEASAQAFDWTVQLYTKNLTFSPVFFFWLNSNEPEGFTSHYFNISSDEPSTTSTSIVAPSTTDSSTAVSSTTASSTTSRSAGTENTSTTVSTGPSSVNPADIGASESGDQAPASSSDPTSLKIGLGVGIGVGGTLCLLLIALIVLRFVHPRKKTASPDIMEIQATSNEKSQAALPKYSPARIEQYGVHEVYGSQHSPVELGDRY